MIRRTGWLVAAATAIVASDTSGDGVATLAETPPQELLIFDAGSSGTRVHVFRVGASSATSAVPEIDLKDAKQRTKKIKPGLSHFAEHSDWEGLKSSLSGLLEFANQHVPEDRRAETPAVLYGTAGLRAVPEDKAQEALEQVRAILRESQYRFEDDSWVGILSGAEEGGLGWVAANYLKNRFEEKQDQDGFLAQYFPQSVGVIELGGGSMQVTFEVDCKVEIAEEDTFSFAAKDRNYCVYAHSYMGYGQEYAQDKLREIVDASESASDPCYPVGYNRSDPVIIEGTGVAEECQALIAEHILSQDDAPGSFSGEAPLQGSFFVIENFFYTREDLGFLDRAPNETASLADQYCSEPFDESLEPKFCFSLNYQAKLLDVLGVLAGDAEVQIVRQVNGGDIDWTLGAAVTHAVQMTATEEVLADGLEEITADQDGQILAFTAAGAGIVLLLLAFCFSQRRKDAPVSKAH